MLFRRWVGKELAGGEFDASLSVVGPIPAMAVEPRAGLIKEIQIRSVAWRPSAWGRLIKRISLALNLRQHLLVALEKKTLRDPQVGRIICISRMIQDQCRRHYQIPDERMTHIPNAVKPISATDAEMAAWRTEWRARWQADGGRSVFLFPALDSRRKGLTPLLHALALLVRENPDLPVMLVLAGNIHESHRKLISQLKLDLYVRDAGYHRDLRPLYAAADVAVLPTYYDTFARVGIEAFMLRRPVITTAYDGAAEMVLSPEGPRGRVVADPDDHAALAQAMRELCDPDERARCVSRIGSIGTQYTTGRHVERLLEVLGGLAESRRT